MQGEAWDHRRGGGGGAEAESIAATVASSATELGRCANLKHVRLGHRRALMGQKPFTMTSEQNHLHSTVMFMLRLSVSDKSAVTDINRNNAWLEKQQHEDRLERETEDVRMSHTDSFAHTSGQS